MLLVNGYRELPIASEHAIEANNLPALRQDPFHRILVAQARVEGLLLLTVDKTLAKYGEGVLHLPPVSPHRECGNQQNQQNDTPIRQCRNCQER